MGDLLPVFGDEMMSGKNCNCVECRIRAAIVDENGLTDTRAALMAMGEVFSELLAHRTTKEAKAFVSELLVARKKYQKMDRVRIQHPEGSA